MRNPHALAPAVLTAFLALAPATAQESAPLDARAFAQRVEVEASPVHAFRYNQPIPAPNQTKALLTRRRAFSPGERVSLSFRLPPGATLAAPLRERVVLSLHGLLGAKLADLGEAAVSAAPAGASGTLDWTVPDVAEGQYLPTGSASTGSTAASATEPWRGPAPGPPDHAEAGFRSGGLAQYGPHVYVYGTIGDAATTAASKAGAEMLADWGPSVRATWRVLADTEVTPDLMATHDLVLVGTAATNRVLAGLVGLPIRQDASGTWVESRKVAGPGAIYRLLYPNPGALRRLVLVYGGGSPAALERFLPQGRSAPKFSLFADTLVIGEDDKVVLEGYFRDGYRIPAR